MPNKDNPQDVIDIPITSADIQDISDDNLGIDEAKAFEEGSYLDDLEQDRKTNNHRRREDALNEISSAFRRLIRGVVFAMLLVILVWFYHLITPTCWHWLEEDRISYIKDLMFSGALSAAVTFFSSNLLKK